MIEKMQFVSITGPKADIDRVVDQYLSRYEIHLENALAQLQTLKTLTPYLQFLCSVHRKHCPKPSPHRYTFHIRF